MINCGIEIYKSIKLIYEKSIGLVIYEESIVRWCQNSKHENMYKYLAKKRKHNKSHNGNNKA